VEALENQGHLLEGVAIIGVAGRFPKAQNVAEFWKNQINGIESISRFRVEDLEPQNATEVANSNNYVLARSVLEDVELFDAEFFGIYPREAELMDPQQRLFLEVCWQAFEDAGYNPFSCTGAVGVYAGCSPETYFLSRLCSDPAFIRKFTGGYQVSNYAEMLGNSRDFLATKVSYKFNLRGPSFTMLAACSTSLLAVTQACQSLLTYQSDMALAGGASITFPQKRASLYQDGGMISPDGHCRAFDAAAQGTVFGCGVAVVLLKRLEDAWRDGDQIYAVIRGFAVNNDGSAKVGYTAPSVEGQSRVIALAHEAADVNPETIGYIEAHGTGTPLGDPIELAALTQAFRARTAKKNFCTIGTAKANVGHLDVAAGVTGLIHAAHVVRDGVFPPTLHYEKPNPNFDFENSPFRVNTARSAWKANGLPRRAGVSAFGVGGTNAHVVVEQAPKRDEVASTKPAQLLVLSARSEAALDRASDNLAVHLQGRSTLDLANAAWTLQIGRKAFDYRRTVVARDVKEAISALREKTPARGTRSRRKESPAINFLFPGQGAQHVNMACEIYQAEPVFRAEVDKCAEILRPYLDADLRELIYPIDPESAQAKQRLTDTAIAQPAIFVVEFALAKLLMEWGIHPQAMLGHSVGEFVAACLAGVFSLEDALGLVATRGKLVQEIPKGGMLSVRLAESDLRRRLSNDLAIAAVNSPSLCVVAGQFGALEKLEKDLAGEGIVCRRLITSHAFHSAMMDPAIEPFIAAVAKIKLSAPKIPYVSGVTGTWVDAEQATDPAYWGRHLRETVQFSPAIALFRKEASTALLEVGPGNVLGTLARQHSAASADQVIGATLSDEFSGEGDFVSLMAALGSMWLAGAHPNWAAVHQGENRQRISLPTYPFERKHYWLEAASAAAGASSAPPESAERSAERSNAPTINANPSIKEDAVNVITIDAAVAENLPNTGNRSAQIHAALIEIFEELSGMDLSGADGSASFLEMGFDSLFLTQVTQSLQTKFELKITFRQLLGDESTLDALTSYLDGRLPAQMFAEAAAVQTVVPASPVAVAISPVPSSAVPLSAPPVNGNADIENFGPAAERLMREQLQTMNQIFAKQLETMSASPTQVSAKSAPATISIHASARPSVEIPAAAPAASAAPIKEEFKPHGPYKPPQKSMSGALNARQQKCLDALIDRHTKRTHKSKNLTQNDRKYLADPRVVSGFRPQWKELIYPLVVNRSKGSRFWDVDGNEYIDIVNGFGPIMLGHRPDFVERAIEKQLHEGIETGPQTPLAGEVAKLFCEMTGNERMTFCNTGSEAVMAAIRVARTVTGRNKVVFFSGDYHGMFDEVLVKGIKNKLGVIQAVPVAPGIPRENVSNMVVLDYGAPESLAWIRQNAKDLAAVLLEPVQSRHPNLQPIEFLKELREITAGSDTALIFDEIVTGFRVHPGGCQSLFGIRADLATYGKVLAGGMPIGILAGKSRFMDALDGGTWQFGDDSYPEVGVTFFAGTFVRHPLTVAAVKAVLEHFKEQGPELQERLTQRTARLVRVLNEFLEQTNVPTRIETFGSIFYFGFPTEERFGGLFYYHMLDKGIHVREGFPCFLTTAHSDADIEQIIEAFKQSALEMLAAGFFSTSPGDGQISDVEAPSIVADQSESAAEVKMTEPQQEIFLAAKLDDDASCSFNESFSVYMRGPLQVPALQEVLTTLISRHEALRATVAADGATLHFSRELKLELPLCDLSKIDQSAREAEVQRLLAKDARMAFDLTGGPLVRIQLIRLDPDSHVLIFTSHHIICDGWSTNVLLNDLAELYSARVQGRQPELKSPVRFSQYARAELAKRGSAESTKIESYWLSKFKDMPAPLDLPLDRPRPGLRSYSGATLRAQIDAEAYRKIKQLGAKKGCTLFATLLAGYQTLLHRLSNQNDIVVGIPTAGQSLLDDGNLVGHCINFLPLRTHFREGISFAELLGDVKKTLLDAYDHQSYTYGTLVRKLGIPRDPTRLPLMEVQFNLERIGAGATFCDLQTRVDPNPKAAVNFDMFFNIVESDQGLMIDCDYNTDLFDEETIARWLKHYETGLLAATADADKSVDDLALMSPAEVTGLIAELNPEHAKSFDGGSVYQLFEKQASQRPDAVAAVIGDDRITYGELNERANKLARVLQKTGVKRGSLVALCFERSLEMIVAFLAVLKSGGAYVPIDSSYPAERLAMIFADVQPSAVLTQESLLAGLPKLEVPTICIDKSWPAIDAENGENLAKVSEPDDVAYVIYTSGSTGKPKGVVVTHRNVVRLLKATEDWFHFDHKDVWTLFHSYAFDFSVWETWGCLLTGGRLVIVPYWVTRSPQDFYNLLAQERVTVLNQTPAAFYQVIQVEESGAAKPLALRCVIFGGAALNFANLQPWFVRHGDQMPQLVNMYGITETTVHVTYRPLIAADAFEPRSLIGAPIPDLRIYLLDTKQRPVPPGVVGEMYIGGAGVARGYLNRPELTSERFLHDPFGTEEGARMYKSGDLARLHNNGDIEYLGRTDSQVKVHGYRIELGEIEAALAQHQDVQQSVIVALKDGPGGAKLVAYIVGKKANKPSGAELREYLQKKLPAHMLPFAYVIIEALPLTVNGKIDKSQLPAPEVGAASTKRAYVAPRTPQEKVMADILSEVLRIEQVGVTDNLFELGADSLHVFQITSRAAKAGLSVTPKMVLQQRTIAGALSAMAEAPAVATPRAPAIARVQRQKYRVSPIGLRDDNRT
jgi:amino acid adenylation domain-containing protein